MGQNATFQCIAGGKWSQHDKLWLQVRMLEAPSHTCPSLGKEKTWACDEGVAGEGEGVFFYVLLLFG